MGHPYLRVLRGCTSQRFSKILPGRGGATAPPSAKEVFEDLVREQCAKVNVNCVGRRNRLVAAPRAWMVGHRGAGG